MIKLYQYGRTPPEHMGVIDPTSRSQGWDRELSPFLLGPVELYRGFWSQNVENAWQYSKVYREFLDGNGDPHASYWNWARRGWSRVQAVRYPMGKGMTPVYSYWDGEKLDYVQARKKIYCPLYARAVEQSPAWGKLVRLYEMLKKRDIPLVIRDFDVYDMDAAGVTYQQVINDPTKKMGHGFVLAMMLDGARVWTNVE